MNEYPIPIERLVDELSKLPGIGRKTALRLAYHIINLNEIQVKNLSNALIEAKEKIHECKLCFNLTDKEYCDLCSNDKRDRSKICVVESPKDLFAIENGGGYNGLYHVLHGIISPMNGIGAGQIRLKELEDRLNDDIKEIIIATNLSVEGDATAHYISQLVKDKDILVTRIAHGVPVGSDLEYFDSVTLKLALKNRTEI
ncbi:MAG: recombination protein RecR [Tissierellia bacterium]|nr:recombination protein RecR [Tissierellia bacterium]